MPCLFDQNLANRRFLKVQFILAHFIDYFFNTQSIYDYACLKSSETDFGSHIKAYVASARVHEGGPKLEGDRTFFIQSGMNMTVSK